MNDILVWFGQQVSQHLWSITLAIASATMVLLAPVLSRLLRGSLHGYPWIVRVVAFIVMCVIGYGAMTVALGTGIRYLFSELSPEVLGVMVVASFVTLGVIAERRGEI